LALNIGIFIGGRGVQAVESLVYLCAAGMGPEGKIFLLLIDPDRNNKNLERARDLIICYSELRDALKIDNKVCPLFRTELIWGVDETSKKSLLVFNEFFVNGTKKNLDEYLGGPTVDDYSRKIVKLFYSTRELEQSMDKGFRGHPSTGAPVITLIKDTPHWQKMLGEIQNAKQAKVFVAGSVFGGTGAAGIPTIGRLLAQEAYETNNRFSLQSACCPLLPYFCFLPSDDILAKKELYAKSEYFLMNSKAALEFYHNHPSGYQHFYAVGYDELVTRPFSEGGIWQNNPSHLIELLGSLAGLCFFMTDRVTPMPDTLEEFLAQRPQVLYACHADDCYGWQSLPLWDQKDRLTLLDRCMYVFTVWSKSFETLFFEMLINPGFKEESGRMKWYRMNFVPEQLSTEDEVKLLKKLKHFLSGKIKAAGNNERYVEISGFFQWLTDIHLQTDSLKLFNIQQLDKGLLHEINPDRKFERDMQPFDIIWKNTCGIKDKQATAGSAVGKFATILHQAAARFCDSVFQIGKEGK